MRGIATCTQHLDSGAQVFSINNTYLVKSNLSTQQTLGYLREKIYSTNEQAFGPSAIPGGSYPTASIDTFGSTYFPGVTIIYVLGSNKVSGQSDTLNIGPNATSQGSNTGVFQNRFCCAVPLSAVNNTMATNRNLFTSPPLYRVTVTGSGTGMAS